MASPYTIYIIMVCIQNIFYHVNVLKVKWLQFELVNYMLFGTPGIFCDLKKFLRFSSGWS